MQKVWAFIVGLFLVHSGAYAQSFSIEERLQAVPAPIAQAVRDQDALSQCEYLGKRLNLGFKAARLAYIVTTADACEWGAAAGPIWIVSASLTPIVLLSDGGNSVRLRNTGQNGLRDVVILQATAGTFGERVWRFDGTKYRQTRERVGANPR